MTDCIIIGSGVAGISVALTLKANAKTFLMFGRKDLSEKIAKAEEIRNYPGLSCISGQAFVSALQAQLVESDIEVTDQRVLNVYALGDKFGVATQEGGYYESKTVVLCGGVENVKTIDGEVEFLGRGVSYCATCDGFLFKGKNIAVICTSKAMEHEVELLASFAQKVYLVALYPDVAPQKDNVTVIKKMPIKIEGNTRVQALSFAVPVGESGEKSLQVDGVFALRDNVAPNVLLAGVEIKGGHVVVDRDMQTNIAGCFAAGDCTGKPYQYAKAAGEGNVAAHSVCNYLRSKK